MELQGEYTGSTIILKLELSTDWVRVAETKLISFLSFAISLVRSSAATKKNTTDSTNIRLALKSLFSKKGVCKIGL